MKQLITSCFLVIAVSIYAQKNSNAALEDSWYVSMIGLNLNDTCIYLAPKGKSELIFGDLLEQKLSHPRFYSRNPKPYYVNYRGAADNQGSLFLYHTKKARRKGTEPLILEYAIKKGQLILVEPETTGILSESGIPIYDKLTVLTRTYDSLHWNKHILGSWSYGSSNSFFDLKTGDTCSFSKPVPEESTQLKFDWNNGSSTCKIIEEPAKPLAQSNGVLDGVYLRDRSLTFKYEINLEKKQITFVETFGMTFKIIELTENSLILVKQSFP